MRKPGHKKSHVTTLPYEMLVGTCRWIISGCEAFTSSTVMNKPKPCSGAY